MLSSVLQRLSPRQGLKWLRLRTAALATTALTALHPNTAAAQDRTLSWPRIEVTAHLDSAGTLRIRESQSIRFSGDWNGAERIFDIRNGQTLALRRLARLDPASGTLRDLTADDELDDVDDFDWTGDGGTTLRWRARLPDAPPFDDDTVTYVIEYETGRILVPQADGTFLLDHNFAMIEREGAIDRFDLTLTLDPAWRAPEGFTGRASVAGLAPGEGWLITVPLAYAGAGRPAAVRYGADERTRRTLAILLAAGVVALLLRLVAREARLGRFRAVPDHSDITPEWIERHVTTMLPEAVGAAWDDHTAAPEVAAVLARMVQEGKLSSRVELEKVWLFEKQELHLTLEVDRGKLAQHERALVDGLFHDGHRHTSTSMVRERYRKTGFDPAGTIRSRLDAMLADAMPGGSKPSFVPTLVLVVLGIGLAAAGLGRDAADLVAALMVGFLSLPAYLLSVFAAFAWQRATGALRFGLLVMLIFPLGALGFLTWTLLLAPVDAVGPLTLAGLVAWALGLFTSVTHVAMSRHSPERIATRQRLHAARRFFRQELQKERPSLRDAWFPYVIAFGLGRHVDRWFRAFGGAAAGARAIATSSGSSGGGSGGLSGGGGWTGFGGGGGFAGGGSSAAFAAAVGGMAASVPAPGSSSSGGGSSSSGGSSGGGGGGGW